MPQLYDRQYSLTINDGVQERTVSGLRVNFTITKSVISRPNVAIISIYNPNKETLALLQRRYARVELSAGYGDDISLIFTGQIRNIQILKTNTDVIATIHSGDGELDWQNATINKTYAATVDIGTIIRDVFSSFENLDIENLSDLPMGAINALGLSLSGKSSDILDDLAAQHGFEWSIQDGGLISVSVDKALTANGIVVLSPTTGLIGSPTLTIIGANATSLLNPSLVPGSQFELIAQGAEIQVGDLTIVGLGDLGLTNDASGVYKVLEVVFAGDNRDGVWTSSVKGRRLIDTA